ncbi:MAG: YIP1 family protein [Candidatus Zixiibacteriota bacterium]
MEQGDAVSAITQAEPSRGLSFRGLVEIFYKPAEFFAALKDNPKVLVPYIAYAILLIIFFVAAVNVIVEMQLSSPQFQERMQGQTVTPQIKQWMTYQTMIGGPLVMLLMPLIAAAFALFWGNVVFSGNARFKQLLSVMLYGELIYGLGMLVLLPIILVKKSLLVGFNLGVLAAGQGPDSVLYLALSKIDLFVIWEIIVIGIGLSILYNFTRNKGYLLSVLSMGMLSILHVVFTAIAKLIF